jgi:hypothetical protein
MNFFLSFTFQQLNYCHGLIDQEIKLRELSFEQAVSPTTLSVCFGNSPSNPCAIDPVHQLSLIQILQSILLSSNVLCVLHKILSSLTEYDYQFLLLEYDGWHHTVSGPGPWQPCGMDGLALRGPPSYAE